MQLVMIIGNLTKDPEMRAGRDGKPVCSFTVAVNRKKSEEADYFKVSVWGEQGEACGRCLAKGRKVSVLGTVKASAYLGDNGAPRASLEVTAREVEFLSPRPREEANEKMTAVDDKDLDF